LTVECDGALNSNDMWLFLNNNSGALASDDCGSITWTNDYWNISVECGATGSSLVTFTATDDCGNYSTTSAVITIEDTTPPAAGFCPADLVISCDGQGNTTEINNWLNSASTTDLCGSVVLTNDYVAGNAILNCSDANPILVTFTATDDCGNVSSCTARIIKDNVPGSFIDVEASNISVECDGFGNTNELANWLVNNGGASASPSAGNVVWTNNFQALSDDCGATGDVQVTFTAVDQWNNVSTTSALFTILDNTEPLIDFCPTDLVIECDGEGNTTEVSNWLNSFSASDICGSVVLTNDYDYSNLSDDCGASGYILVNFTATDDCFNETYDRGYNEPNYRCSGK